VQKKQASRAKELSEKEHAVKACDTNIDKALQNPNQRVLGGGQ
jgi:hypothetical protein